MWFRIVYAGIFVVAISNLVGVVRLLNPPEHLAVYSDRQLQALALHPMPDPRVQPPQEVLQLFRRGLTQFLEAKAKTTIQKTIDAMASVPSPAGSIDLTNDDVGDQVTRRWSSCGSYTAPSMRRS